MTTFNIPTPEKLTTRLAGLDKLLTARKWERAAIVWAFTTNDGPGQPPKNALEVVHSFPMPVREFARQGFKGLVSQDTVRKYRQAWQSAIDAGHVTSVAPGDTDVELPPAEFEWPGTSHDEFRRAYKNDSPERKAEVAQTLLDELPPVHRAKQVRRMVEDDPTVAREVAAAPAVVHHVRETERAHQDEIVERARRARAEGLIGSEPIGPNPDRERHARLVVALDHLLRATVSARIAVDSLVGVDLTEDERRRFTPEADQLGMWLDALRRCIDGGDLDDELRALLEAEA
jgi:hypothetical protein